MKKIIRDLNIQVEYDLRSICSLEEMLLFDIETTGLSKERTQLYLIGCAFYEDGRWKVAQWLTENTSDEAEVLEAFLHFAESFQQILTFNGERFDVPYLAYKADFYGIPDVLQEKERTDLYARMKLARKLLSMSSMSQKSIEQFLGVAREDQLDGGKLIPIYYEYEKTLSEELEHLLLLHNFDDIQGMLKILPFLSYADLLEGQFTFNRLEEQEQELCLIYQLKHPLPKPVEAVHPVTKNSNCRISADKDRLKLILPILKGIGRTPLENVADYYYLIEEDRVIHKDVAQFLERSRRVKATKKNCFLKKEGRFVPLPEPLITPCFYLTDDSKSLYGDLDQILSTEMESLYQKLAASILKL